MAESVRSERSTLELSMHSRRLLVSIGNRLTIKHVLNNKDISIRPDTILHGAI